MPPNILYKYVTPVTAKIVLESGKLRWSSPELFNDPSEFQRIPRFEPSLEASLRQVQKVIIEAVMGNSSINTDALVGSARALYQLATLLINHGTPPQNLLKDPNWPEASADIQYAETMREFFGPNFIKQARVMCLTANPLNASMWANYASLHTGCLLGFRHLPEQSTPFIEAREVQYFDASPVVGSGLDFLLYGGTKEILGNTLDRICFSKKSDWSNEKEWRVVTWRSNEGEALHGDYPFYKEELESVTFGLNCTDDFRSDITRIIQEKYHRCALFKISKANGELHREKV